MATNDITSLVTDDGQVVGEKRDIFIDPSTNDSTKESDCMDITFSFERKVTR